MASLKLNGDSSGSVTISAPAAGGSVTVTLPAANGTILAPATVATNGVVLIGNTVSGGFDTAVLTGGNGTAITNDKGSITVYATQGINYAVLNGFAMP